VTNFSRRRSASEARGAVWRRDGFNGHAGWLEPRARSGRPEGLGSTPLAPVPIGRKARISKSDKKVFAIGSLWSRLDADDGIVSALDRSLPSEDGAV